LFRDLRAAETRLTETTCRRTDLERQLGTAPTRDIADLTARIAIQVQLEASARADLRAVSEELDTAVRGFQIETGIDGPTTTETVRITFDLDEIPPPDILRRAASPEPPARTSGMTDTEVRTALRSFPRMLELYDRTGIALTITPPPYIARGGTLWEAATHDTPKTHIYYRPAYTATIATFATTRTLDEQGGQSELLRFFATATDEVIHRKMPVQGFAFSPTDFGERKISLGFDDRGRLIRFEQSGKSSVVGATAAVADAVQTARDEYATTLARIAEIQDTQRQLQQSDVITEIDRLRKQRDLLDARLELAGTRGSYDLLLERKRIDAELAAIQGRRALADERDATSLGQEVGELRTRLDQLARDLEEIKHRSEQSPPVRGR
ncbi:MAG: hypothetical protein R3F14_46050, partial [Polyangiaceae bacterium]